MACHCRTLTAITQGGLHERKRRHGNRLEAAAGRELEHLERTFAAEALAHNETEYQRLRGDVPRRYVWTWECGDALIHRDESGRDHGDPEDQESPVAPSNVVGEEEKE